MSSTAARWMCCGAGGVFAPPRSSQTAAAVSTTKTITPSHVAIQDASTIGVRYAIVPSTNRKAVASFLSGLRMVASQQYVTTIISGFASAASDLQQIHGRVDDRAT